MDFIVLNAKNMSEKIDEEAAGTTMMCCANCGKAEVDDIKLRKCNACKLVRYCSTDCQKNHRKQHKKACKKRAAEIRDDKLFQQPDESHFGECPICCLPLSLDMEKSTMMNCCYKVICMGCVHANDLREEEQGLEHRCVFCREPEPETPEEREPYRKKRLEANDPMALYEMGVMCREKGDFEGSFKYYTKAAKFGNMMAHYNLSLMYHKGEGVEKDEKKYLHHMEEAAIGGHHKARYNLADYEKINGRIERAKKHFIIAANLGYDDALEQVKVGFHLGFFRKEDYETALRGHQAAVDATKSQQRDLAELYDSQEIEN